MLAVPVYIQVFIPLILNIPSLSHSAFQFLLNLTPFYLFPSLVIVTLFHFYVVL